MSRSSSVILLNKTSGTLKLCFGGNTCNAFSTEFGQLQSSELTANIIFCDVSGINGSDKIAYNLIKLIDRFINNAMEVDVDAISDGDEDFVAGIDQVVYNFYKILLKIEVKCYQQFFET